MMLHALDKITTIAACDALIVSAQKKKQTMERKAPKLIAAIDAFRERIDYIDKETAIVKTLLDTYTAAYNALSEGSKDKVRMNVEIKRAALRQARLDKKALTYNVRALLIKEFKYALLSNQITAIDEHITDVQNRRAALQQADPTIPPAAPVVNPPTVHPKKRTRKRVYKLLAKFAAPSQNQNPPGRRDAAKSDKKMLISKATLEELGIDLLNEGTRNSN